MKGLLSLSQIQGRKAPSRTKLCGGACKLNQGCRTPQMAPTGKGERGVLIVAEAPGKEEDRRGIQLIGESGQLLRETLKELGVSLDRDCRKTNAVICRPPENATPDFAQIDACRRFLLEEIDTHPPKVIVALGGSGLYAAIGQDWPDIGALSRWVGWTIPSRRFNAWVCPTWHPAYLLRTPDEVLRGLFREHLRRAFELEERPWGELPQEREQITILSDPQEIRERLRDYRKKGGTIAFDYETTGLKPEASAHRIVSCGICYNGRDTVAFLMDGVEEEVKRLLLSPRVRKIAANLKFEERWSRAKLGIGVKGWDWDTMLAAHILNNNAGVCGLKFQAFVRLGLPDYSTTVRDYLESPSSNGMNRIQEVDQRDLLLYNGMDALLEYKVAVLQMKEMKLPWREGLDESHLPGCLPPSTKRGHRPRGDRRKWDEG